MIESPEGGADKDMEMSFRSYLRFPIHVAEEWRRGEYDMSVFLVA